MDMGEIGHGFSPQVSLLIRCPSRWREVTWKGSDRQGRFGVKPVITK